MISVKDALSLVTGDISITPPEQIALSDAPGRVLAVDVASRLTQPPSAVSSMDGYAVRCEDFKGGAPVTLKLIGESAAGKSFPGRVAAGETVRIFTGAPLPDGADAVEMQENTEKDGDAVTFNKPVPEGRFIRPAGLDFKEGEVLIEAGKRLTARDIGLAAAMNIPWLTVRAKPRIAFIATGNELAMPGDPLGDGGIVSSNSLALAAMIRSLGGIPMDLGIASDDVGSLKEKLRAAKGAHMLVTIGGASVGDYDLVGQVLAQEGLELNFYKVAMRPGKPLIFGYLKDMPVLGLPGNPVSAGVTSVIFLKPALEAMLGLDTMARSPYSSALLGCGVAENDQRQSYLRAALSRDDEGNLVATPFQGQDSAMLALFARADCLVVRQPFAPAAAPGSRVEILPLSGCGPAI